MCLTIIITIIISSTHKRERQLEAHFTSLLGLLRLSKTGKNYNSFILYSVYMCFNKNILIKMINKN